MSEMIIGIDRGASFTDLAVVQDQLVAGHQDRSLADGQADRKAIDALNAELKSLDEAIAELSVLDEAQAIAAR